MGIYKCETFQKQGLRLSIEFVAFAGREVGGEEKKKKKLLALACCIRKKNKLLRQHRDKKRSGCGGSDRGSEGPQLVRHTGGFTKRKRTELVKSLHGNKPNKPSFSCTEKPAGVPLEIAYLIVCVPT